jgi:predicted ArsR family transcriptional regulator
MSSGSGGRPRTVTDDEIVRFLHESGERVLTTAEVAEGVDVSRRTAQRRLSALADEGRIGRKDVGARGAVWWALAETPDAPAAPLQRLVGVLDTAAADSARERSEAWRESFDEDMAPDEG